MRKHVSILAWVGEGRGSHPEGATRPLEGRLLMAGAARISSGSSTTLLSLSFVGDLLRNKMNERWASANSAGSENVNSYSSSASSASSRVLKGVCPRPASFIDWVVIFLSGWGASASGDFKYGTGDRRGVAISSLPIISGRRKCANLLELELETFTGGQSQLILVICFPWSCVSRLAKNLQQKTNTICKLQLAPGGYGWHKHWFLLLLWFVPNDHLSTVW